MLGDNGLLDFTLGADTDRNTLDLIRSFEDGLGGKDELSGGRGQDVGIGGTEGDTIFGDDANYSAGVADVGDILLGDNADIFLGGASTAPAARTSRPCWARRSTTCSRPTRRTRIRRYRPISGNAGGDIIAGGVQGDYL